MLHDGVPHVFPKDSLPAEVKYSSSVQREELRAEAHTENRYTHETDDTVKDEHTETRQRRMTTWFLFSFSTFIFIRQMNAWKQWPRNNTTYCSDFQWKQTTSWLAQNEVQFVPWSHFVPGDLPLQGPSSEDEEHTGSCQLTHCVSRTGPASACQCGAGVPQAQ